MTREAYHRELRRLEGDLQTLANMSRDAIQRAVQLIERRDVEASHQVVAYDDTINARRFQIESDIMTLIATQAPVARDMRELAAMLEIAGELERIGDYAKGIANINLKLGDYVFSPRLVTILGDMAGTGVDMMSRALDAFERRDHEAAASIIETDDEVDDLFNEVFRMVVEGEASVDGSDELRIEHANYVLWVAHNLERTADRVTNVCERVIFTVTGRIAPVGDPT